MKSSTLSPAKSQISADISQLLNDLLALEGQTLMVYPVFSRIGGGVNAALFLSQALAWTPDDEGEDGWFSKTPDEWFEAIALPAPPQQFVRRKLRALGFLQEESRGSRTFCRLDFGAMERALIARGEIQSSGPRLQKASFRQVSRSL